jgi:predicted nucleotidyltransferase
MLKLASQEQTWLDSYRQALADSFPDLVEQIIIYGSKARGDAGSESDIDVLVILRRGDRTTKAKVRQMGHLLAVTSEAVPSIMIYTLEEWSARKEVGSPFYHAVTRDGVRVA